MVQILRIGTLKLKIEKKRYLTDKNYRKRKADRIMNRFWSDESYQKKLSDMQGRIKLPREIKLGRIAKH